MVDVTEANKMQYEAEIITTMNKFLTALVAEHGVNKNLAEVLLKLGSRNPLLDQYTMTSYQKLKEDLSENFFGSGTSMGVETTLNYGIYKGAEALVEAAVVLTGPVGGAIIGAKKVYDYYQVYKTIETFYGIYDNLSNDQREKLTMGNRVNNLLTLNEEGALNLINQDNINRVNNLLTLNTEEATEEVLQNVIDPVATSVRDFVRDNVDRPAAVDPGDVKFNMPDMLLEGLKLTFEEYIQGRDFSIYTAFTKNFKILQDALQEISESNIYNPINLMIVPGKINTVITNINKIIIDNPTQFLPLIAGNAILSYVDKMVEDYKNDRVVDNLAGGNRMTKYMFSKSSDPTIANKILESLDMLLLSDLTSNQLFKNWIAANHVTILQSIGKRPSNTLWFSIPTLLDRKFDIEKYDTNPENPGYKKFVIHGIMFKEAMKVERGNDRRDGATRDYPTEKKIQPLKVA